MCIMKIYFQIPTFRTEQVNCQYKVYHFEKKKVQENKQTNK